jgi:hypothetical protein
VVVPEALPLTVMVALPSANFCALAPPETPLSVITRTSSVPVAAAGSV